MRENLQNGLMALRRKLGPMKALILVELFAALTLVLYINGVFSSGSKAEVGGMLLMGFVLTFLQPKTLLIICLGLIAFCVGTAGGVLFGKLMYVLTGGQVNPLIGSAGVSAVPMAARVSQKVGQSENPSNFLLMHAMGPNVAGVIGSAVAAGILINIFG